MDYTLERSHRRTITLSLKPDGKLIVKAPHLVPKLFIDQFVQKHADWVEKKRATITKTPLKHSGKYLEGDTFYYQGKQVTLTYGAYPSLRVVGDILQVPVGLSFRIKKELESWYIAQGKIAITKQLTKFAQEMETSYTSLSFSDTKSKWGSCSHLNELQFNWRLIMAPTLVLNYVVIHELAHTIHKNHSHDFWRLVEKHNPSFRQNRKWLKENGHSLVF